MLDLNFVRENLETVRAAMQARNFPTSALDEFVSADAERRRVIAESDDLNRRRNELSRQIGALMKEGRKEEAEEHRTSVAGLKESISDLDRARDAERLELQRAQVQDMDEKQVAREIKRLEKRMLEHARNLEFEEAARTRDELSRLKAQAFGAAGDSSNVLPLDGTRVKPTAAS